MAKQNAGELPALNVSNYLSNTYTADDVGGFTLNHTITTPRRVTLDDMRHIFHHHTSDDFPDDVPGAESSASAGIGSSSSHSTTVSKSSVSTKQQNKPEEYMKRLVRVIIADPDKALQLEDSLIYSGEELFTDSDDQELFFEIDIKPLLEAHNAKRQQTIDKKATNKMGRDVFLEPIKIRNLAMTVVEIARF
jgi:hypothetical protein